MDTTLAIQTNTPIGTINPRVYGHFAEHLGRCCYDGLWSRDKSGEYNFRNDVLAALKALPVPMLRWPGGCYADHYHWRDGIGPRDQRVTRLGMSCGLIVEDDNTLGTHEFMYLCQQIGAEPYLAGNVGSGTPQELCDWLEYCNATINTTLVKERCANGSDKPFGVKLWGVGNENWGCGGNYDSVTYAKEYRRYATMLRHVDPTVELVLGGAGGALGTPDRLERWNRELIQTLQGHHDLIDHISIHVYWIHGGPETNFTENDYYTLLSEAHHTEQAIKDTAQMLREEVGNRKIGIALDEWGVWHPEARPWGPSERATARDPITYEQANTLRDAIAAGIALEGFHRQCNVLSLANLAQIVNVLQSVVNTDGERMWLTPTYHVLKLHTAHIGAQALPVEISQGDSLPDGTSAVTATASTNGNGTAITFINRHYTNESTVRFKLAGSTTSGRLLAAPQANTANTAADPDAVHPINLTVSRDGTDGWCVELPPHSMATVVIA
jgi:alpha-N-arabinofuranosidase